nr:hypothetical protein [Methanobacterium formicicum]
MVKKRESNIKVGITCKCQDAAVARPPSLLRKVQCKKMWYFFSAPTVLKMALICVLTVELADNLLENQYIYFSRFK